MVVLSQGPNGEIEILEAPDHILVADLFIEEIELGRHPCYSYGDGILTVHATNGDLSYGLHHYDNLRRIWHATRATTVG